MATRAVREICLHDAINHIGIELYGKEWKQPHWPDLFPPPDLTAMEIGLKPLSEIKQRSEEVKRDEERRLAALGTLRKAMTSGAVRAYTKEGKAKDFLHPEMLRSRNLFIWGGIPEMSSSRAERTYKTIWMSLADVNLLINKERKKPGPKSLEKEIRQIMEALKREGKDLRFAKKAHGLVLKRLGKTENDRGCSLTTFRRLFFGDSK